jgi:hypothetical protein
MSVNPAWHNGSVAKFRDIKSSDREITRYFFKITDSHNVSTNNGYCSVFNGLPFHRRYPTGAINVALRLVLLRNGDVYEAQEIWR